MSYPIQVTSEIGNLKEVLLHRPGKEVENLTPSLMNSLLFDDIPFLKIATEEHDSFADVLRTHGVKVVYLEDLAAQALDSDSDVKTQFISQFLDEAEIKDPGLKKELTDYCNSFSTSEMIEKIMAGVRKEDVGITGELQFLSLTGNDLFVCDPMPNLYFTRDPFATLCNGVLLNTMSTSVRRRETIFGEYIFRYHPEYEKAHIPIWYDRYEDSHIEGGDVLVLSKKVIAVGISQRTEAVSIEKLASRVFADPDNEIEQILAIQIPHKRVFMHLDTVFTQVDYDKFVIHANVGSSMVVYKIAKDPKREKGFSLTEETQKLEVLLEEAVGNPVTLIRCGNGDPIDASREQWNDGSNTLAIAPGEVVVYSRNYVTNELLDKNGIKTHVIPSSELSRGRGGPRCMSMPLIRDEI